MAERERHDEDAIAQAIILASYKIKNALLEIADAIRPRATKLRLLYELQGGNTMGAPVTGAVVGQNYNPTVVESNATTPSIPPIGPLVYASDNTAVVTVNPTGGVATMVAAGTANLSVIDQGNNLTDTVAFTVSAVTPPVATNLTLSYTLA
jgi:hypothetical protein